MIKANANSDDYTAVGLVDLYSKDGCLDDARKVYDSMPQRGLILRNALISGCSHGGRHVEVLSLFCRMRNEGLALDINRTILADVLKSTASLEAISHTGQVHVLAEKIGLLSDSCPQWAD
jgi:pentatricopeptide repeat protein